MWDSFKSVKKAGPTTDKSKEDNDVNSYQIELSNTNSSSDSTHEHSSIETTNGTPIEKKNPLGNSIGPLSVVTLILQGIVGTGIFTTPGTVLKQMGSVGASYVLWILCFFFPLFSVYMYIEFAGYYPKRNGGDVAYLEQAYPKPKFLIPTTYAAISVILSYTTTSALAFGQYILSTVGDSSNVWHYRGIAIGALTFSSLCWVILGGHTRVSDPHQSFRNVWEGTTSDGNNIANSIIKVAFSYSGYSYAFGVVAEHTQNDSGDEEQNKKKLLKTYAVYVPLSLFAIFILYILIITSYFASSSPAELKTSGNSIATTLFKNTFGNENATKALAAMVALSALGHLITAVLSHSRALRECGRQGVLPFSTFWTSIKPLGTPLGPIFITWLINFIMIVAPPAGSAYNFILDMGTYSGYIFSLCLVIGLLKIRRERALKGLGKQGQYLPLPFLIILLLFDIMVIAIAFVPPKGTLIGSDVTFFYATYPIVTICILLVCLFYYTIWRFTLPKIGKYVHREVIYRLENGELGNTIVKVKLKDLEEWDLANETDENGVARKLNLVNEVPSAGWADKLTGESFPFGHDKVVFTKRNSLKVCGLFIPWNFSLLIAIWNIALAIAAGNCVVVKQSEITSLSLLYVCKSIKEAGFPSGFNNVISGIASTTGKYLTEHLNLASSNLKQTSLEFGGKSPMIVFSDTNIEATVTAAVHGSCMSNMGQICCATSRVYKFKFERLETAIERANNSIYGLTLSFFTSDLKKARSIANKLEACKVFINSANELDICIPFGGVKQSENGRELGVDSILVYTSSKSIHINLI
ncbi:hypothetical protein C6P40_002567 [Pichia californica]|uniref:Aldehyde dehydrogenase domain-containing protein n=1 Tax=Pichia californica TaxID=460514 RepID=A0A9P6WHH0_9ASCO|nr:hypothetical protein C6P42_002671 [[Candida] californica]KAG0687279.1 hypothetical protein C6P40_002567 [[Candida] californica]